MKKPHVMDFTGDCYIERKSLLYKTKVDYQLDRDGNSVNNYAINHVQGCSHGCKYPCYAYLMAKRFGQVKSYEEWCQPKVVGNTLRVLEGELRRKRDVRRVHLSFTTDPFPYVPKDGQAEEALKAAYEMTLLIIAELNHFKLWDEESGCFRGGIPVTVLTKGLLPEISRDSYDPDGYVALNPPMRLFPSPTSFLSPHPDNYYGISLVSLNENFRKEWEPNTAPYAERIASLKALHDAGCKTWVSMEPFPALTPQGYRDLYGGYKVGLPAKNNVVFGAMYDKLINGVKGGDGYDALRVVLYSIPFVDRIVFGRWNYNKNMPTDVEDVDAWYKGAADVVRDFCKRNNIECIIKKGVE